MFLTRQAAAGRERGVRALLSAIFIDPVVALVVRLADDDRMYRFFMDEFDTHDFQRLMFDTPGGPWCVDHYRPTGYLSMYVHKLVGSERLSMAKQVGEDGDAWDFICGAYSDYARQQVMRLCAVSDSPGDVLRLARATMRRRCAHHAVMVDVRARGHI